MSTRKLSELMPDLDPERIAAAAKLPRVLSALKDLEIIEVGQTTSAADPAESILRSEIREELIMEIRRAVEAVELAHHTSTPTDQVAEKK